MKILLWILVCALSLTGCASQSSKVTATPLPSANENNEVALVEKIVMCTNRKNCAKVSWIRYDTDLKVGVIENNETYVVFRVSETSLLLAMSDKHLPTLPFLVEDNDFDGKVDKGVYIAFKDGQLGRLSVLALLPSESLPDPAIQDYWQSEYRKALNFANREMLQ